MTFAKSNEPISSDRSATASLPIERRYVDRVQTVFRVARVITAGDEGLARIRNISDLGARVRLLIPLPLADSLILQLADDVDLTGKVVWNDGCEFGLRFDQQINCAALLAALAAGARCGSTRPVRLAAATTALTHSELGLRRARVIDISQRGLKLMHDGSLTEGLQLKVTLPSGLDRHGIVRWTKDDRAGILLRDPLSVDALGSVRQLVSPSTPLPGLADAPGRMAR